MARRVPRVVNGILRFAGSPEGEEAEVGSDRWFGWLADPATRSFSFQGRGGTFTARKERRSRGGGYWVAYRKRGGRLRKGYLGKAEELTLTRLEDAAETLAKDGEDRAGPGAQAHSSEDGAVGPEVVQDSAASAQEASDTSFLRTKLSLPSVRGALVPRPGLVSHLGGALSAKLTLVSAPAGFGKTTLLATWIESLPDEGEPAVAWLSLDPADNDPVRFWSYFAAAAGQVSPGAEKDVLTLLRSPQAPPIETILTVLINALADLSGDSVLVLDDYHAIESPEIHQALSFFVEHLPPRMHLVIATRADPPLPLARMRARGQMIELRAAELRFTPQETEEFLDRIMGLPLPAEENARLHERTEGWIVGLQLAAHAMRGLEDTAAFVETFAGSNRHVIDYLAEEVLGRQPEALQAFLLRTSVLEPMCGPLCDAVVNRQGGEGADDTPGGQEMLEYLEQANLFVVPLDHERRWYRYHHLFADVLRQRVSRTHPDIIPELHCRAAGWFERQGLMSEAVRHALAAGHWEHAADLIEGHGLPVMLGGQVYTTLGWIDVLPDRLVRSRPTLCVIHATGLTFTNQLDAAELRLQHAERLVGHNPSDEASRLILGQVAQLRAIIARFSGDIARCVELASRALELLPETETLFRSGARLNVSRAYQLSGGVGPDSERLASEVVRQTRASGSLIAFVNSMINLAQLRRLQGRLGAAAATYRQTAQELPGQDWLDSMVGSDVYYVGLGDIHREWNDLDAAERLLKRGIELVRGPITVDADVVTQGHIALAFVDQALGRHADALARLNTLEDLARHYNFLPSLTAHAEAEHARLALAQGDLPTAVRWAEVNGLSADGEVRYPGETEYLTLARVLIAQGRQEPTGPHLDAALRLLGRLLEAAERGGRIGSVIEVLTLQALTLREKHNVGGALAALESALVLARPEGYVRTFVDEGEPMATLLRKLYEERRGWRDDPGRKALAGYSRRLLAAFESPYIEDRSATGNSRAPDRALLEPLTARELEVMRLISEGFSNREIAARLFVEVSTVKSHVNSIFRKLAVESRARAVSEARKLGVIPD